MFNLKIASLPLAAAAVALLGVPAQAAGATGADAVRSFRSVEWEANPAGAVESVRADLAARIPAGTPLPDARALLRSAGAHCGKPTADGRMRCRYNDVRVRDDFVHDVSWIVDLQTAGDKVTSLGVARASALD